ncbi:lipoprotein LpqV [Mycobacterium sp. MYCO198283]|uniref:lipoprotein LpqV n=1 Tax=Mycobacterium sp. MYCO198283 TaxID=2883505 RepID=UPI001E55799C|nr:lipoprotein LpqV [Mycobacterium sp. MYCO198283]MCG5430890.1 lipoprotein LpqV [Mycobacterium sp. MYCO198283]
MRTRICGAVSATAALVALLAGCSSDEPATPSSSAPPATSTTTAPPAPESPGTGAVGISPGGVTTSLDVPAESTEDDYFDLCLAAKNWMTGRGGDLAAQVEPYLAEVQRSTTPSPGTFNALWPQLTPGQQSAVIVAAQAAAAGGC